MARITALYIYPIKSCGGIAVQEAVLGRAGLQAQGVCDREWMVVSELGRFITQRDAPMLAVVRPAIASDHLRLEATAKRSLALPLASSGDGPRRRVQVWNDTLDALDAGDEPAEWFSALLDRKVRLVRFDPRARRLADRAWTGAREVENRFSDGFPMLLIAEASLADFNERWCKAGDAPLPMDRFRPNIVIDGVQAYDEDHIAELRHADYALALVKPCPRCTVPSVDQRTGVPGASPLDLLASYRGDAKTGGFVFGQNVIAADGTGQLLRVGDVLGEGWTF